jgi:hypothetical protein
MPSEPDGRSEPSQTGQGRRTASADRRRIGVGILLGIVAALVAVRFVPQKRLVQPSSSVEVPGDLLREDEGPLHEIVFHFVPSLESLIEPTYSDFFRAIDPSTRLVAIVPTGDGAQKLRAFLAKVRPALEANLRIVEVAPPITLWSKDRALVAAPRGEASRATLLIPLAPDPHWVERRNDWATLSAIAKDAPSRYFVRELPLEFDAGDFTVTGDRVLVDVNLVAKNAGRGLATPEALAELLTKTFGRKVTVLGRVAGDVPRHHMSMYMAPLGSSTVLVGDPPAAQRWLAANPAPIAWGQNPDTGGELVPDFSPAVVERFERAAKELAAAGFRVERVPVIPFDDKTYVTYTNGIYETRAGKKIAYVPVYGLGLDELAKAVYERLGWEVKAIRVKEVFPFHGTIGCLVNVLSRG